MLLSSLEVGTLRSFKARRPVDLLNELKVLNPDFPLRMLVLTLKSMVEKPSIGFHAFTCEWLEYDTNSKLYRCKHYKERPLVCRQYPPEGSVIFAAPHCTYRQRVEEVNVVSSLEEARELNRARFLSDDEEEVLDFPTIVDGSFAPIFVDLADEYLVRQPLSFLAPLLYRRQIPLKFPRGSGLKLFSFLLEHGIPVEFFYQTIKEQHPYKRLAKVPPPHVLLSQKTFSLVLERWVRERGL